MDMNLARQAELFTSKVPSSQHRKFDAEAAASVPLYIGCAGWGLSSAVKDQFPSQGTHLERYSRVLPAVEINSSFYRPHRAATYARWHDSVPDTFRFSVKMPRSITHYLRLKNAGSELLQFLDAVHHLRHKLGCLLVQLPPSLQFGYSTANDFFGELRALVTIDIVCEPRHASWAAPEADAVFDRFGIARVAADPPAILVPPENACAKTVYVRLHGAPIMYHSAYSDDRLAQLAIELTRHIELGRRVWCILDNTASGAALPNALFLIAHLEKSDDVRTKDQHKLRV
jgi:uncharacterized protein YecE (DUF72 family)